MMKLFSGLLLMIILYASPSEAHIAGAQKDRDIIMENGLVRLKFSAEDGSLMAFTGLKQQKELLADRVSCSPWKIQVVKDSIDQVIDSRWAKAFHYHLENANTLFLEWSHFSSLLNDNVRVSATVKLTQGAAFSTWEIAVSGLDNEKLKHVIFPNMEALRDMGNEELAMPSWMGEWIKSPRSREGEPLKTYALSYPGPMSMQFIALYNQQSYGLYLASNDTLGIAKQFILKEDSSHYFNYQLVHFPVFDTSLKSYTLPYQGIVGLFNGDWLSAAQIYKEWAVHQSWTRNSRLSKQDDSSWVRQTALWVWNRGRSANVLTPAVQLSQRINLPVNVFWHWWHNGPYDDAFPEYFPPREGRYSFDNALTESHKKGVRAIVYMNAYQWGTSTRSFRQENALQWAVRDISGNTMEHVYNIFTRHSLTPMCIAADYWKNKYRSLVEKATGDYGVDGIYMDQSCLHFKCYSTKHHHAPGGGSYWVNHFADLTRQIRSGGYFSEDKILAGEGAGENWLPYLDAMLTLQASKERYAGVSRSETIPLFQAVYHPYAITFGSYSSLVKPPYDEFWPKEFAPVDAEQLLDPAFNEQFMMEQARAFVWGMQPTIANYHEFLLSEREQEINYLTELARLRYQLLKYLLYGELIRMPIIDVPEKLIPISRLSIYAGQGQQVKSFEKKVPLLYSAAWKSREGSLGIALASIHKDSIHLKFDWDISGHIQTSGGRLFSVTTKEKRLLKHYTGNTVSVDMMLPPRAVCFLELEGGGK